jgi:Protein of unknown function (DUF2914)
MPPLGELNRRFGPWISLVLGIAAVFYMQRGLGFAPVAVGVLLLAWILAAGLRRITTTPAAPEGAPETPQPRWRRLALPIGGTLIASLWQDILFYLLPLWWVSTVMWSSNMVFPTVLVGMALLSCFDHHWRVHVLDQRIVHAIWSATILFATLVPSAAVLGVPLRIGLAVSAAMAALVAAMVLLPQAMTRRSKIGATSVAMVMVTTLVVWSAPLFPPVPVTVTTSGAGTAIRDRNLVGEAYSFPSGTQRVYVWFAVSAPARYHQTVRFEWFHDGEPAGGVREAEVVGGRVQGFRTWSSRTAPAPGVWRVELRTNSSQLIARTSFEVQ